MLLGKLDHKSNLCVDKVAKEIAELTSQPTQTPAVHAQLKLLLSSACYLSKQQIFSEFIRLFPTVEKDLAFSATNLIDRYCDTTLDFRSVCREPVILVLDPHIQSFPWESLPCLTSSKQPMSRVPSVQYLATMKNVHDKSRSSVVGCGVSQDSVFYMINPDKSLPKTQERLEGVLKNYRDWEGISGEPPKPGQLANVLKSKDAFIYSGHGSGSTFLSSDEIKRLKVRSVPVLLGCRSAELTRYGRNLDPLGIVQSYLIGSSPALVGFLWPVTDVDLDQWTIKFLEYWLKASSGNLSLLQAVADQRREFNHFVNAAGLVVYGFPVLVKER